MIECESCGANLTLKDAICPYCKAENPDAIEHVRMLKYYQELYQKTKQELLDDATQKAPIRTKRMAVGILLGLNILCMIFALFSYDFTVSIRKHNSNRHQEEILVQAQSALAQHDAYAIISNQQLSDVIYDIGMQDVYFLSKAYTRCHNHVTMIASGDTIHYLGRDGLIQALASQLTSFMRYYQALSENEDPTVCEYAQYLKRSLDELLIYYTKLPDDQLEAFYQSGEAQMGAMLSTYIDTYE